MSPGQLCVNAERRTVWCCDSIVVDEAGAFVRWADKGSVQDAWPVAKDTAMLVVAVLTRQRTVDEVGQALLLLMPSRMGWTGSDALISLEAP